MLFNSLHFGLFFPVVVAFFFATPKQYRWILLLAASYYFYASWKVAYLGLILLSTLVDYAAGIQMGKHESRAARRPYLLLSLLVNLGILFTFKYFNFFIGSAEAALASIGLGWEAPVLDVLLPVGISFYTFQTLAYTIDVYRDQQEPEHHLGRFALYVSFFPQLVAGPIERSQRLLPQFREAKEFDYQRVVDGLKLMLWGFFKKLVIADRLALYVNEVYGAPEAHGAWPALVATYFFAFQIYCDFSGYSDIAIGAAQVMGYDLMENFRRPYHAKSINEFWHRWHISLSTWFRDYLYIPLGGNRVSEGRWYFNLFTVFVISGLWHGAAWTFVVWGALHGGYLIVGILTQDVRDAFWNRLEEKIDRTSGQYRTAGVTTTMPAVSTVRKYAAIITTFHLVLLGWVFFRANTIGDAFLILQKMTEIGGGLGEVTNVALGDLGFVIAVTAIIFMELVHLLERRVDMRHFLSGRSLPVRWAVYYGLVFIIIFTGIFNENAFIYFQF
ncbi:MBOAT family O-acyltransferase [Salinibacter ruber]|uniref:MBOAT family O-acyltransferase n=1 Tax=Salinibacter ruber TaxID=146919 RepID=UPI0021677AC3|nr:MBOAT family O-acyltransferase [Salinibacter ruber]MCS4136398.1 D-alanyl-lipoteichoic acid acyltransferase DltB (MBOAT superfamily) [Salinibacter ruber]